MADKQKQCPYIEHRRCEDSDSICRLFHYGLCLLEEFLKQSVKFPEVPIIVTETEPEATVVEELALEEEPIALPPPVAAPDESVQKRRGRPVGWRKPE